MPRKNKKFNQEAEKQSLIENVVANHDKIWIPPLTQYPNVTTKSCYDFSLLPNPKPNGLPSPNFKEEKIKKRKLRENEIEIRKTLESPEMKLI